MNKLLDQCWKEYLLATTNNDPNVENIYKTYASVLENFIRTLEVDKDQS